MSDLRFIKADHQDNVGVAINENGNPVAANANDRVYLHRVVFVEPPFAVAAKQKIATREIPQGAYIIRYGVPIAEATKYIDAGEEVSDKNTRMHTSPPWERMIWLQHTRKHWPFSKLPMISRFPIATAKQPDLGNPLENIKWMGFPNNRNIDRGPASRNVLGIIISEKCAGGVAKRAGDIIRGELLPDYPNVDRVTVLDHDWGCGFDVTSPYAQVTRGIFNGISSHPNFGAICVVSLGCGKNTPQSMGLPIVESGPTLDPKWPHTVTIQDGTLDQAVQKIVDWAKKILPIINQRHRQAFALSTLTVPGQCGGSCIFSGITANRAIGRAFDFLAAAGARVMPSETSEIVAGVEQLLAKCTNLELGYKLIEEILWYDEYLRRAGGSFKGNPTPGNRAGGLSSIFEKSLGSIEKFGSSMIQAVLRAGEIVEAQHRGLLFLNAPANDFKSMTTQAAAGGLVGVMSTGQGRNSDLSFCPWLMIGSNTPMSTKMHDAIDCDAGRLLQRNAPSLNDLALELARAIIAVAGGEKTKGEIFSLAGNFDCDNVFAIFEPGPTT